MTRSITELGLPVSIVGSDVNGFFFNAASESIIVTIGDNRASTPRRVFVRLIGETGYREIGKPEALGEFIQVATSEAASFAFLLFRTPAPGSRRTVYSASLPEGRLTACPPPTDRTQSKEIWVSTLLAASADGTFLYVITGSRPRPEPTTGYSIDYSLCRMVVATGEVDVVKVLETPFA